MTFGETLRSLMRERGLSLRRLAKLSHYDVGYLSKVANGHWTPSRTLAERLDTVLDADGRLLALVSETSSADNRHPSSRPLGIPVSESTDPDERERLILAARNPARLDTVILDGLAATLAGHRRIEDILGAQSVIGPATEHLGLILRLLKEARGPHTGRLAAIASEASQFTGWLHTATGAHEEAGAFYDQALRLGLLARNNDLAATALSMRGHLAWITGDIGEMAALSEAAAESATAPGTRTVAIQQRGRALAVMGERQPALRAIGRAEDTLTRGGGPDDPDGLYFYSAEYLTAQRGLILAYLAEEPTEYARAADTIMAGVEALPPNVRGSEWMAWYRVRAAAARAAGGDISAAVTGLRAALDIVTETGSRKVLEEIVRTHRALAERHPDDPHVTALGEALP
ncbi:helix-turn-helix domain-containing protein [Thermomonospora amylolytica]|uniref:helix-turn-helix domain-containing protein n=1 Tax=Thermomonospora amylolytica TaxID=1411117 RepID=UPI000E6D2DA1|nr:helix-turn-helix transcriptional regulator [Thermomonospora amylolytica]